MCRCLATRTCCSTRCESASKGSKVRLRSGPGALHSQSCWSSFSRSANETASGAPATQSCHGLHDAQPGESGTPSQPAQCRCCSLSACMSIGSLRMSWLVSAVIPAPFRPARQVLCTRLSRLHAQTLSPSARSVARAMAPLRRQAALEARLGRSPQAPSPACPAYHSHAAVLQARVQALGAGSGQQACWRSRGAQQ